MDTTPPNTRLGAEIALHVVLVALELAETFGHFALHIVAHLIAA